MDLESRASLDHGLLIRMLCPEECKIKTVVSFDPSLISNLVQVFLHCRVVIHAIPQNSRCGTEHFLIHSQIIRDHRVIPVHAVQGAVVGSRRVSCEHDPIHIHKPLLGMFPDRKDRLPDLTHRSGHHALLIRRSLSRDCVLVLSVTVHRIAQHRRVIAHRRETQGYGLRLPVRAEHIRSARADQDQRSLLPV